MRLRKIESIAIAITLAFICFMGGYFVGSRGDVSIVAMEQRRGETQQPVTGTVPASGQGTVSPNIGIPTGFPTGVPDTGVPSIGVPESPAHPPPVSSGPEVSGQVGEEQPGAPRAGDGKININLATQTELTDLPGIGNVLAGRIVDYRNQNGAFSTVEDIMKVSGIGAKRFESIKDKITVG